MNTVMMDKGASLFLAASLSEILEVVAKYKSFFIISM